MVRCQTATLDMSVAIRLNEYISGRRPDTVCDACISRALGIRDQQVNQVTVALATTSKFDRRVGSCCDCGKEQKVTCKL